MLPGRGDAAAGRGGAEARWRLSKYLAAGADMACYKGGAGIRGPQSTGLVLGKAEFIADCRENGFPNQSVLRAAKVCKEEIFGLIAAVEGFMAEDDEALTAVGDHEGVRSVRLLAAPGRPNGAVEALGAALGVVAR